MGFWLHHQLWGTEVCQGRKWLDLPVGRQQPPLLWTSWVTTSAYEGQRSRLLLIQAARVQIHQYWKKKRNNNPRGLLIHYIGKELCTSLHLMCVHWDDTAGTSSLLMIWSGLAFLQKHTKCDRIPKRHILICWKALRFATGLCSNFLFIWPLVLITRKIKSPWMTCTLGWQAKERLVLTSLYFPQNRPLCPCAALGVGEDKQTAQSNVTRRPQNKSRTPGADWQSHSCCPLSVLHCTSVKCHPHAHQLPHRSNENVYDITKADFPTSHHWTKAPKIPSAKREKWRKSSHVHFGQGTNG